MCTSCGLCCAGALHDTAALAPDERTLASAAGLALVKGDFALPCPRLVERRCAIYPHRPRVCSRYRCRLLSDMEGGRLDLPSALQHVRTALALTNGLARLLPEPMTLPELRKLWLRAEQLPPPVQLQLAATTDYLDRHFRPLSEAAMATSHRVGACPAAA